MSRLGGEKRRSFNGYARFAANREDSEDEQRRPPGCIRASALRASRSSPGDRGHAVFTASVFLAMTQVARLPGGAAARKAVVLSAVAFDGDSAEVRDMRGSL